MVGVQRSSRASNILSTPAAHSHPSLRQVGVQHATGIASVYGSTLGAKACSPGTSSPDPSTLIVNPEECCPGGHIAQCLSIEAGAWMKAGDAGCDETCVRVGALISATQASPSPGD
jgi:hypothetical protein